MPTVELRNKRTIYIVEDHPIFREGIVRAVNSEPDLMVVGFSDSAVKAISAIEKLRPDLAIIDLGLPGRNGLELIKDLRAIAPKTAALVLSMHDEMLFAERALRAGARGYVMKDQDTGGLLAAVRDVLKGKVYVSAMVSERVLLNFAGASKKNRYLIDELTDRELSVLQLIGLGSDTAQIARNLHISAKTVIVHKARIREKLRLKTSTELIRYAVAWTNSAQQFAT